MDCMEISEMFLPFFGPDTLRWLRLPQEGRRTLRAEVWVVGGSEPPEFQVAGGT